MNACIEKMEADPKEIESWVENQDVHDEDATVHTI
jgi:hypothetical protein